MRGNPQARMAAICLSFPRLLLSIYQLLSAGPPSNLLTRQRSCGSNTGDHRGHHHRRKNAYMADQLTPAFAYTVVYVNDVAKSVAFYSTAFGCNVRRLDNSHKWGELESGQTTIAFTPLHQRETDGRTGTVRTPVVEERERGPVEVCFDYADVDAAYKRAVENGAVPVSPPEVKNWRQKVGYVRDIDGIVVRLGSHVE